MTVEKKRGVLLDEDAMPALTVPPGETLREELRVRNLTQTSFAKSIGRPLRIVNEIIAGKKAITAETALQFEEAIGISARFWLNLETQYRLELARKKRIARAS